MMAHHHHAASRAPCCGATFASGTCISRTHGLMPAGPRSTGLLLPSELAQKVRLPLRSPNGVVVGATTTISVRVHVDSSRSDNTCSANSQCSATKLNGERCTNRAKYGGYCGIAAHLRQAAAAGSSSGGGGSGSMSLAASPAAAPDSGKCGAITQAGHRCTSAAKLNGYCLRPAHQKHAAGSQGPGTPLATQANAFQSPAVASRATSPPPLATRPTAFQGQSAATHSSINAVDAAPFLKALATPGTAPQRHQMAAASRTASSASLAPFTASRLINPDAKCRAITKAGHRCTSTARKDGCCLRAAHQLQAASTSSAHASTTSPAWPARHTYNRSSRPLVQSVQRVQQAPPAGPATLARSVASPTHIRLAPAAGCVARLPQVHEDNSNALSQQQLQSGGVIPAGSLGYMLIAFDTETTGLLYQNARLLEVALRLMPVASQWLNMSIEARAAAADETNQPGAADTHQFKSDLAHVLPVEWSTLANPEEIPRVWSQVSGITPAMVQQQDVPSVADALRQMVEWVNKVTMNGRYTPVFVAHNGKLFDIPLLRREMARCNIELPQSWLWLDTLPLARELVPAPSHKQAALIKHFGLVKQGVSHRAAADAKALSSILEHIIIHHPEALALMAEGLAGKSNTKTLAGRLVDE